MPKLEVIRNAGDIKSLPNLLTKVRKARRKSPTGAVWLRGLPNAAYDLVPSIGREHSFGGKSAKFAPDIERNMLHRFRRHAFPFLGRTPTEWEALFVARHHGLPVRLLDWTSDPLVALYFACEFKDQDPPDGKIWFLIPNDNSANHIDALLPDGKPLSIKGIKLVYPNVVAPRINAQSGFFTIQDDPRKSLNDFEGIEHDEHDLDVVRLIEFIVPAADRSQRLKDLNDMGVTRRTLYPDLDGLSAGIVNEQILRS